MHLTWRITLPGQVPRNITYYDNTSDNSVDSLNSLTSTLLAEYIGNEYVESTLILTLQANISANQTVLWCGIGDLGYDSIVVTTNSSGKLTLSLCMLHIIVYH